MSSSTDRYYQSLTYLVPTGFAWPRNPDSVLMRVLLGVASAFAEHHDWTRQSADEWLPHLTRTRLTEWEGATGLPDPCFGPLQSYGDRRARVVARLRGWVGDYGDSSPASPGAIEVFIANMGYPGSARYNVPFRVGRDRVGRRMGVLDGRLHVLIPVSSTSFRAGINRVSERLVKRPISLAEMVCSLEHRIPARYQLNVILT